MRTILTIAAVWFATILLAPVAIVARILGLSEGANGVAQWQAGGIRFADLGMSSTQDYGFDVDADGNALLAFLDDRNPHKAVAVTIIKVSPAGLQLWGTPAQGRQPGRSHERRRTRQTLGVQRS